MMSFESASAEHVRRLNRLIERGGIARLRKLYNDAQAELESRLARAIGRAAAPFTVHQYRVLLAQVRQGQMQIARRIGDESAHVTEETQKEALSGIISQIKKLEAVHDLPSTTLPIEEASRFAGILDKRKTSLLAQARQSMASYGAGVVRKIESNLAVALASGASNGEAIDAVAATADIEFWRAERIVRTEKSWAAHATISDGIRASADALVDLMMRWTELVSESGSPLDDRVGADSVAMHGQVASPGGMFTMPDSARSVVVNNRYGRSVVSPDLIGESWAHPPNRPNDRATIVPWRPQWGSRGWKVVGGSKVAVRGRASGSV
jgi:hypothetical protein